VEEGAASASTGPDVNFGSHCIWRGGCSGSDRGGSRRRRSETIRLRGFHRDSAEPDLQPRANPRRLTYSFGFTVPLASCTCVAMSKSSADCSLLPRVISPASAVNLPLGVINDT